MKEKFVYLLKVIIAAGISVGILSLFSLVYYNPPMATIQQEGITNYKLVPNSMWSTMIEGYGYGKINDIGYNSTYYTDCVNPDIVFAGSSHLESVHVPHDSNFIYLLNEKFDTDDIPDNDYKCMNIGISGHSFKVVASNFEYIANHFQEAKYVVLEMSNGVVLSVEDLDGILDGKFHKPLEQRGVLYNIAQKIPYCRLLFKKVGEISKSDEEKKEYNLEVYTEKVNEILSNIMSISEENGIRPIMLMHRRFTVDSEGNTEIEKEENITKEENEEYTRIFLECCEKNNIKVIDATPSMISGYKNDFKFSYGFSNTVPGKGHLNKTGHRIISEVLYDYFSENGGEKNDF